MFSSEQCCFCYSVRALNIIDYEKRCRRYLNRCAPSLKWALLSLESLTEECKQRTDLNAVEYDTYPLFQFLKGLPTTLPFDTDNISLVTKLKYLYFKRKLLVILKDNLFNEYIDVLKETLSTLLNRSDVEVLIKKFIKVCNILHPQTHLAAEDVHQYEFIAELLNQCYELSVQDSQLVTTLVTMAIDRNMIELSDSRFVRQPLYPQGFFTYILEHVVREKFDIMAYCSDHPRTLWEYSRNFSVVNAVSFGNSDRAMILLKHGFEVFPEYEIRRCGHGFPLIEEVIPRTQLMVLQMMSRMHSINLVLLNTLHMYNNGIYSTTKEQKECFRLIWRAIPDPFVKYAEMGLSITTEYFHLIRHGVLNPKRYDENTKYCIMYEMYFMDMAVGAKEPRSLKHLSRCTVRKSLRQSWSLPHGIFQLGLPKTLEQYLNLEWE
ncbi:SOCS box domain-containing protein [Nephila pilipes]|uniref:SOCS box domain-containing protein n=1 Tax=Nephila pilipes TaxID=299642 RepID=A0A8X6T9S4_NEPPI|nr:SOCS box domain-containing protein [Nephila pilipes]